MHSIFWHCGTIHFWFYCCYVFSWVFGIICGSNVFCRIYNAKRFKWSHLALRTNPFDVPFQEMLFDKRYIGIAILLYSWRSEFEMWNCVRFKYLFPIGFGFRFRFGFGSISGIFDVFDRILYCFPFYVYRIGM